MPNEGDDDDDGFGGKSFDETKQSDDDCLLPDLDVLWKIATPEEMTEWQSSGILSLASSLDRTDGFMHLSNAFRMKTTANLYFKGRDDLRLLKIETKKLTQNDTRSVVFADEAPSKRDTSITDGLIYVHYLLVQGKACCAHAYELCAASTQVRRRRFRSARFAVERTRRETRVSRESSSWMMMSVMMERARVER